jgi:hypothetical protein
MLRKISVLTLVLVLSLAFAVPAFANPGKPAFTSNIYADGKTWGTKGAAILPAPTDNNAQSFDMLFAITNGVAGQLPVAEAAPGNPNYNGGRWFTQTVTWKNAADAVLLTSYADIMAHMSELTITAGSPDPAATPNYFECPLLPDKTQ